MAKINEGVEVKRYWLTLFFGALIACQPITPVPTQTPIPELTSMPSAAAPVKYELQQPQSSELLAMIDSILSVEQQTTYEDELKTEILEREYGSLHLLIGEDFGRYYIDGFSNADNLVIQETLPWDLYSYADQSSISVVLRIALLQYINKHQEVLENPNSFHMPNSNIRVFPIDLDGDGNLEWLIGAEYRDYSFQNWLLVGKQADGYYHALPGLAYDWLGADSAPEIVVQDLTGDGNPEIIKSQYHYFAGGVHGAIDVFAWNGNGVKLSRTIDLRSVPPVYGEVFASEYKIEDVNGDGIADIQVSWPRFRRFDCQWTQTSIYYLDGRSPDVEVSGEEIPQTDECLIARALEHENLADRIPFYKDALRKFDANASPIDKLAWIKLQLAMAYTANGSDDLATAQLKDLINIEGDGKFLKFIRDKYAETNTSSSLVFCDALYSSIATQVIPEPIGSEIDIDLTHGAYPIDFAPIAGLVCPFPDVLHERLNKLSIPASESPIDTLVAKGYTSTWSQSLDWDNDSQKEWLGVLNFSEPVLVYMDSDKNWQINSVKIDVLSLSKIESGIYTSTDDTDLKVLVLFSGKGKYCDSPKTTKWLVIIDPTTMKYDTQYLCDADQYSLSNKGDIQSTVEEFSKLVSFDTLIAPDWYYLPGEVERYRERPTVLNLVDEIENDVLNQTDWERTSITISNLIASLPEDDAAAQILLSRLYYLRGLNYELAGQNELAVDAYINLIQFAPKSLWSQYAQTKLQPIQP